MSHTNHHRQKRRPGREFNGRGRYLTDGLTAPNFKPCAVSVKQLIRRAERRIARQQVQGVLTK